MPNTYDMMLAGLAMRGEPKPMNPGDYFPTCDVCGHDPASDCRCQECRKCGVSGDPACYVNHGLLASPGGTDMAYRRGFLARKEKQDFFANPYTSKFRWARFRKAWERGWLRAENGLPLFDY